MTNSRCILIFFFGIGILYILTVYYAGIFQEVKNGFSSPFTAFFIVLPLNILSGMEHVFQVFLFVVNILCFYRYNHSKLAISGFYITLLLMGLIRFESMFYFVILAFMFALVRKWKETLLVLLLGFIPIIAFCAYNYQQDGYFFPNSVVVKGTKLSFDANILAQLKVILLDNLLLNISFYKIGFFRFFFVQYLFTETLKRKR